MPGNTSRCQRCDCSVSGAINQTCTSPRGVCTCRAANFQGPKCATCSPGYFNVTAGCPACKCHPLGSDGGSSCDAENGTCRCRAGFAGPQCAECERGFYPAGGNGLCTGCDDHCDVSGSTEEERCDRRGGACRCKRFVTGVRCDVCQGGFVDLTGSNPDGCSRKFVHCCAVSCCREVIRSICFCYVLLWKLAPSLWLNKRIRTSNDENFLKKHTIR